jgi:60 kDa SS-A/Ro ribonucleoprotein
MAKTNIRPEDRRKDKNHRLAGGYGPYAARQDAEALLRRSVMACLLWEDLFYEDGKSVVDNIKALIPVVHPELVKNIAIEARLKQKLRHVPLLIVREMARLKTHRSYVGEMTDVFQRADEITELVALYWKDGRQPLSGQIKKLLAGAFDARNRDRDGNERYRFDTYNFAKYDRDSAVKFRDVMKLVRPKPPQGREELYRQIKDRTMPSPDTWEVSLSAGKNKVETFTRLIREKKLGALAFLRNLRLMGEIGVPRDVIREGFQTINPRWLLPLNYLQAQKYASGWERELEEMMFRGLAKSPKLPGHTIFVVDVSGSMRGTVSAKSEFGRIDAACALAMIASEVCESISVYATAGNDHNRIHKTALVKPRRGFALMDEIKTTERSLGGGGIFTRQCLEYIRAEERGVNPARIMVFSDSQDCDIAGKQTPAPFGRYNYIIDVSAHKHGVAYKGVWTAEIAGWSEHFLAYVLGYEGLELSEQSNE